MSNTAITTRPTTYPAIDRLVKHVRDACREELVHYAGAAHRDAFAWLVVQAFLSHPELCEADLRVKAHTARGQTVDAAYMRRHYSTTTGQHWAPQG